MNADDPDLEAALAELLFQYCEGMEQNMGSWVAAHGILRGLRGCGYLIVKLSPIAADAIAGLVERLTEVWRDPAGSIRHEAAAALQSLAAREQETFQMYVDANEARIDALARVEQSEKARGLLRQWLWNCLNKGDREDELEAERDAALARVEELEELLADKDQRIDQATLREGNARAKCELALARVERLRAALQTIIDGIPRPEVSEAWRTDGKPSKSDKCPHGLFMYEACEECISDFARAALKGE